MKKHNLHHQNASGSIRREVAGQKIIPTTAIKIMIRIVLFFCFFSCKAFGQANDSTGFLLQWNKKRPLTFDDYKQRYEGDTTGYLAIYRDKNGNEIDTLLNSHRGYPNIAYHAIPEPYAQSELALRPKFDIQNNELRYSIFAVFDPYKSFMHVRTVDMLIHEQNHFDLCEVYARKLRKNLRTNIVTNQQFDLIKTAINSFNNQVEAAQKPMDTDSQIDFLQHGNIMKSSLEWHTRISAQLDSLDAYKEPCGVIILK